VKWRLCDDSSVPGTLRHSTDVSFASHRTAGDHLDVRYLCKAARDEKELRYPVKSGLGHDHQWRFCGSNHTTANRARNLTKVNELHPWPSSVRGLSTKETSHERSSLISVCIGPVPITLHEG
jgi:hypothetical protein